MLLNREQEFSAYLDRSGIIELITNAMVYVYGERNRPLVLIDFIKTRITAASFNPEAHKLDQISKKLLETHMQIEQLQEDNRKIRASLGMDANTSHISGSDSDNVSISPGGGSRGKAKLNMHPNAPKTAVPANRDAKDKDKKKK